MAPRGASYICVFREKYTDDEIGAQIPIYMLGTPALISCIFRNSYGADMSVICVFREKYRVSQNVKKCPERPKVPKMAKKCPELPNLNKNFGTPCRCMK